MKMAQKNLIMKYNELKELLKKESEDNHSNYVKAILSIELNTDDEEKLDYLYDEYLDSDIQLVDENFYEFEKDYDTSKEKSEVDIN